jgi:hypothetical protein
MSAEFGFDCMDVFLISDIKSNLRSNFATNFVEKHAHELICHI